MFDFPEDMGYAEIGLYSKYQNGIMIHGDCLDQCQFY
jgi:hypothetical protein